LGPGPPPKRGGHRSASRTGTLQSFVSSEKNKRGRRGSDPHPVLNVAKEKDTTSGIGYLGDRWNRIRYQREDEALWGGEAEGSSVGLSGGGRARTSSSSKYYVPTVHEIEEDPLPPIVSIPRSSEEARWMLQPPPSAKVMAGKARPDLSACDSPLIASGRPLRRARPPWALDDGLEEMSQEENQEPMRRGRTGSGGRPYAFVKKYKRPPGAPPPRCWSRSPPPLAPDGRPWPSPYAVKPNDTPTSKRPPLVLITSTPLISSDEKSGLATFPIPDHPGRTYSPDSPPTPTSPIHDSKPIHLLPPASAWLGDLDVKQVCAVHVEIDPNDNQSDDGLHIPHNPRPFRWSMDI
jgi:hypothetical protein